MARDALTDRPMRQALDHWLALRPPDGGLPPETAFDTADLPDSVLRHLGISTGFGPDGRLKAVFAGSVAAMFAGTDAAGRYLDDLYPPPIYAHVERVFRAMGRHRLPIYVEHEAGAADTVLLRLRRLALPFAGEDGRVSLAVIAMAYEPTPAGRQVRPKLFKPGLRILSDRQRVLAV